MNSLIDSTGRQTSIWPLCQYLVLKPIMRDVDCARVRPLDFHFFFAGYSSHKQTKQMPQETYVV